MSPVHIQETGNTNRGTTLESDTTIQVTTATETGLTIQTTDDDSTNNLVELKDSSGNVIAKFEYDGTLAFAQDATTWDDLQVNISSVRLPTSNAPTWTAYKGGQVLAFSDSTDNTIYFTAQLPHGYQVGSDIEFHAHVALPTTGAAGGAENIKWDFTHSWSSINGAIPNATSVTETFDVQNSSAETHYLQDIAGTITGTDKNISSMILCSLKRDTTVADNYGDDVYLLAIDFHFLRDTIGSREEVSK